MTFANAARPALQSSSLKLAGFSGKVVLISTFYTGCAPGRFVAPAFAKFCHAQKRRHKGKFECITSLKGSSSCSGWAKKYFNLDGNETTADKGIPITILDSDAALHYTFFNGNPQFVLLRASSLHRDHCQSQSRTPKNPS